MKLCPMLKMSKFSSDPDGAKGTGLVLQTIGNEVFWFLVSFGGCPSHPIPSHFEAIRMYIYTNVYACTIHVKLRNRIIEIKQTKKQTIKKQNKNTKTIKEIYTVLLVHAFL